MPLHRAHAGIPAVILLLALCLPGPAATVNINPSADTTLSNIDPTHNFGASRHLMSGGLAMLPRPTRMLARFDVAGSIPAGSTIIAARLSIVVTRTPSGPANSTFQLRRIHNAWIEGSGGSTAVNDRGSVASGGSISWNSPFPGGGTIGTHYSSTVSSDVLMTGNGIHTFTTRAQLAADVQDMLDKPASNFGWLIGSQGEATSRTVRRIGSSENPAAAPVLTVDFEAPPVPPITLSLTAAADTGLFENNPDHNLGGLDFAAIGTTGVPSRSRGLFKFDLSQIPAEAVIVDAELGLSVLRTGPSGTGPIKYQAQRLLTGWGEGAGNGLVPSQGLGQPALAGEATWNHALSPGISWAEPGGSPGTDFESAPSASTTTTGIGPFTFDSQGLRDDLAYWIANPERNFGWIVSQVGESEPSAAARIGTRENQTATDRPTLLLTWDFPGPEIKNLQRVNSTIQFEFVAYAFKPYAVERRRAFGIGNFLELQSFPAVPTNRLIRVNYPINIISPLFYRVRTP